jgi:uncharacterized membrane protein YphA (DoxX/SURF4 family)
MRNVTLWIGQILLGVFFAMAGFAHAFTPIDELARTAHWAADAPVALVRFIGVMELLGALGVILPRATGVAKYLTPLAAIGLAAIMVLAIGVHLGRGEVSSIWMHPIVIAVAAFVAWGRWDDVRVRFASRRRLAAHGAR